MKIFWILSIALIISAAADYEVTWNSFLLGGHQAGQGEFSFVVSIQLGKTHLCGGSLINPDNVLTACHCLAELTPGNAAKPLEGPIEDFRLIAGTTNLTDITTAQIRRPKSFWFHPHCAFHELLVYDVGVVTSTERFQINQYVTPVKLFSLTVEGFRKQYDETLREFWTGNPPECLALGWGRRDHIKSNRTKLRLRALRIYGVGNDDCSWILSTKRPDIFSNFSFEAFHQTCMSIEQTEHKGMTWDSGSPFVCSGFIMGVNSYYLNNSDLPSVFAPFTLVMQWLLDTNRIFCLDPLINETCAFVTYMTQDWRTPFSHAIARSQPCLVPLIIVAISTYL